MARYSVSQTKEAWELITETYLSREKITTEVYATKCEAYIEVEWGMSARVWGAMMSPLKVQTPESMGARQNQALENIVRVGTQGKRSGRGNIKETKKVSELL